MSLKNLLSGISMACLVAVTATAAEPLRPRAEVSMKGGNKRSILSTEFWLPIAQHSDRVLYADMRLMGDNDQNREGNFGLGYREINPYTKTVIGFHGWYDQRRTENNSTFRQLTFGAESLGNIWDLRANGYVPLDSGRALAGFSSSNPYLADTSIYYDINGFAVEVPQYGMDAEVGYRLPVLQRHADAIRVFGGGYHFFRNDTDNVTGFRVRTEAQINSAFSVGARFQHDEPRGSQGFLEATIKFPFGAKKLYQTEGLRARLDESPERDVDIVTSQTQVTGTKMVPVLNVQSGTYQRVIHVDNSNTDPSGGNGTKENPYTTLAAAEAALRDNDVIYINRGDGTTAGMANGLVINKANVSVIGSGVDFIWDNGKFFSRTGTTPITGTIITRAGLAPVLTNTDVTANNGFGGSDTGNGIYIADGALNTNISGINITNATADGIYALAANAATNLGNITISRVNFSNNVNGIHVHAENSGQVGDVSVNYVDVNDSNGNGIYLSNTGGTYGNVQIANSSSNNNNGFGILLLNNIMSNVSDYGRFGDLRLNHITVNDNTQSGIHFVNDGYAQNIIADHIVANNNTYSGIVFGNYQSNPAGYSRFDTVSISNISTTGAVTLQNNGLMNNSYLSNITANVVNVTNHNANMGDIALRNITVNNGTEMYGVNVQSYGGNVGNITLTNIRADYNSGDAIHIQNSGIAMGNVTLTDIVTNNNDRNGVSVTNYGSSIGAITLTSVTSSNNSGSSSIEIGSSSGTTGNITLSNIIADDNDQRGIGITGSNLANVSLTNVRAHDNGSQGIYYQNYNTAGNITLTDVSTNHNIQDGLSILTQGNVGNMTFNNVTSNDNEGYGVGITNTGTSIGNIHATNVTTNNNLATGFYLQQVGGTGGNVSIINANANDNGNNGIHVFNSTTFGNVDIQSANANNNSQSGIYVQNHGNIDNVTITGAQANNNLIGLNVFSVGSSFDSLSIATSSATNNQQSGLVIFDPIPRIGLINLGNNTPGSGQNRIFGNNTSNTTNHGDLQLGTNAITISAQGNWWGQAGGPVAGQIVNNDPVNCPNTCGTADTANALNADPDVQSSSP